MSQQNQNHKTAVTPDPIRRIGAFLIELAVWILMNLAISFVLPLPAYAEVTLTWLPYLPYKVYMLRRHGSALGHMATGVSIVDYRTGEPVSTGQAIARTLPEILYQLVIPLIVNGFVMLAEPKHRQLFDRVAGTIAVRRNEDPTEVTYVEEESTTRNQSEATPTDPEPSAYRERTRPPF